MNALGLGAVALLDVLGFKGIWQRQSPRTVLQRMRYLRGAGRELQGPNLQGVLWQFPKAVLRVMWVCDTIIISATLKRGSRGPRRYLYRAVESVASTAGRLILNATEGSPPFLLRGCLAAGEMLADSHALLGPAVDEAAEWYEAADGAFFMLTPSAKAISDKFANTFLTHLEPTLMWPYKVPLKGGGVLDTLAFTYGGWTQDGWTERKARLLAAFGPGPLPTPVQNKKENTSAFLEFIEDVRNEGTFLHFDRPLDWPDVHDLDTEDRLLLFEMISECKNPSPELKALWDKLMKEAQFRMRKKRS